MSTDNNYYSPKRKRRRRIFYLIFLISICIWVFTGFRDKDIQEPVFQKKHGTAVIITGAAAKIAQEAALLEHLHKKGKLNNVVFISGASSGALNAVVLNAILEKKITWSEYINILSNLSNNDIFTRNGNKLPVNTQPLRNLIKRIVTDSLGYKKLSDLPYTTSFSIVNLKVLTFKDRTYRLCNHKINSESDSSLNIVDVLMASTSYPIAFPPVSIENVKTIPNIPYHDGGIASDHVPFHSLIEFEKYSGFEVDTMLIISRKRDSIPNTNLELEQFGIDKFKFFDKLGVSPEAISNKGFYKRLKELEEESPNLAKRTYVYVPDFKEEFLMFDFTTLKKQYEVTLEWAKTHDPVPLGEYLKIKE
ncbi:MAG: patatin-like phospholipase family protein [Bacteroidales bacterium]|nr:patatin-like phospholipase family protein [Bacteroidales bacterium]